MNTFLWPHFRRESPSQNNLHERISFIAAIRMHRLIRFINSLNNNLNVTSRLSRRCAVLHRFYYVLSILKIKYARYIFSRIKSLWTILVNIEFKTFPWGSSILNYSSFFFLFVVCKLILQYKASTSSISFRATFANISISALLKHT